MKASKGGGGFWGFVDKVFRSVDVDVKIGAPSRAVGRAGAAAPRTRMEPIRADRKETYDEMVYRSSEGEEGQAPAVRVDRDRQHIARSLDTRREASEHSAPIPESGGAPLGKDVRARMEPRLGANLGDVRVHTSGSSATAAESMSARAFTIGNDVHFGSGNFRPGTKDGDKLLAHELSHVVQGNNGGAVQRKAEHDGDGAAHGGEHEVSHPDEPAEKEADAVAEHVAGDLHGAANGGGAKAQQPAPPKIHAKLEGVGRKIFRKPKPPPPSGGKPTPAATPPPPPEQRFKASFDAMLPEAKAYALDQLGNAAQTIKDGDWAGIKTFLEGTAGFKTVMGEGTRFGGKIKGKATEGAQQVVDALTADGKDGIDPKEDAQNIVQASMPKVHRKQDPYGPLYDGLVAYALTQADPVATAATAYAYSASPDTRAVVDKLPPDDDKLIADYDAEVTPRVQSGEVQGNATGLRNQFAGNVKYKRYIFAGGFRTQMQQVLVKARKLAAKEFPQLAGVEVQLGKKRIDYTCYENQKDKEQKKDVAYEVKNWSGFARNSKETKGDIITKFITQGQAYLASKGGLVVQIKGGTPPEAQPALDLLKAQADKAKKIFRVEAIP